MLLRIGAGIAAGIAVALLVVAGRSTAPRIRRILGGAAGGVVVLAVILMVWPEPLTLYRSAEVPAATLVFYESVDQNGTGGQVTNNQLHAIRGTDATDVWHVDLSVDSTAQIYQGQILVMANKIASSSLTALRLQDGHRLWQIGNLPVGSQFTLVGATVYVTSVNAANQWQVAAYSLTTQSLLWSTPTLAEKSLKVVGQPNVVYLIGDNLMAVHPADGHILWQTPLGSQLMLQAVGLPDELVLSTTTVQAYDAATGKLRWTSAAVQDGFSSLTAGAGMILGETNSSGRLIAWNASSGAQAWESALPLYGFPTVTNSQVYFTAQAAHGFLVSAYDIANGTQFWQVPTGAVNVTSVLGPDIIANSGSHDQPSLLFLDAVNGHQRLTISSSGKYTNWSTLYQVGNTLFATIDDNVPFCSFNCGSGARVVAYDIRNGQEFWDLHTNDIGGVSLLGTLNI